MASGHGSDRQQKKHPLKMFTAKSFPTKKMGARSIWNLVGGFKPSDLFLSNLHSQVLKGQKCSAAHRTGL